MWLRLLLLSLSWSPFLCLDVCLKTSGLSVAAPGRKLRILAVSKIHQLSTFESVACPGFSKHWLHG